MTITVTDSNGANPVDADVKLEWNNSSILCLQKCGELFRRRIILKERRPRRTPLVSGSAFHSVSCKTYKRKLDGGEYPMIEEVRDLGASLFEAEWQRDDVVIDPEDLEAAGSEGAVRGALKDFVIDLATYDREVIAPGVNPVAVEHKIVIDTPDLTIHGTEDLVHGTETGGRVVLDKKSSRKAPNKDAADKSQQFDMYGLLELAEQGTPPVGYRLDYVYQTPKKKETKHVLLESSRTVEDLQTMVLRINVAAEAVKKGVFIPTSPDNWWCSEKFCEFFSDCPYVKRGARPSN